MKTQIGTKLLFGAALLIFLTCGRLMTRRWQQSRLRGTLIEAVLVRDTGEAARLLARTRTHRIGRGAPHWR